MRPVRLIALTFGVTVALVGVTVVIFDVVSKIGEGLNRDPNFRQVPTFFPTGTIVGGLRLSLGYRLIFTKPNVPGLRKPIDPS